MPYQARDTSSRAGLPTSTASTISQSMLLHAIKWWVAMQIRSGSHAHEVFSYCVSQLAHRLMVLILLSLRGSNLKRTSVGLYWYGLQGFAMMDVMTDVCPEVRSVER